MASFALLLNKGLNKKFNKNLISKGSIVNKKQLIKGVKFFHSSSNAFSSSPLFKKILIANRGEIAIRIMKTAKKMGIKTVAVYSDADRNSLFVRMADESVHIGPPKSSESYLRADKILEAAKQTGADAIHPGYGFLSENSRFVETCEKNGIAFIGPPSPAMDALGDKIHSKKVAKNAGVSLVPGFIGEVNTIEEVIKIANEIGYPVMIKASAGGGGKGMRIAWNDAEAKEGYRLSKQEALSSFGDDRILIEKFIDNPRHIEFQVLADGQGNAIYLPERECSIQRRNQKVVEEAPSPFVTPEVRKKMGEQAVALAKAVNYKNTGTVEFLIDPQSNFYFLEMNTRLQVEHPITEQITGIDIVEHMIRIAAGQKLGLTQDDVKITGWAMESRVYAEDPLKGFLPSIGRLTRYKEPKEFDGGNWIRSDSGIVEGSEISIYYDPLISKLVTYGETRDQSIHRMAYALDSYVIRGLNHNICFLRDVMSNQRFLKGNLSTKFIPEEYPKGFKGHVLTQHEKNQLVAVSAAVHHLRVLRDRSISGKFSHFSNPESENYAVKVTPEDPSMDVIVSLIGERHVRVATSNGEHVDVDLSAYQLESPVILVQLDFRSPTKGHFHEEITMQLFKVDDLGYTIQYVGMNYPIQVVTQRESSLMKYMPVSSGSKSAKNLLSPMAGQLISVAVTAGQAVVPGQELAIVEAMKMQNVLRAEREGVVKAILAEAGKPVSLDQILIEFK